MSLIKHPQVERLEAHVSEALTKELGEKKLFSVAPFSEEHAEQTGSSDYSYWRSTFRAFRRHWVAMGLLVLLLAILIFTFIQPYLPGQFDPNAIANAENGLPLKNQPADSLIIGISVALIEAAIGILVGILWGYVRQLDFLLTELYNILDNIPTTIVLILVSFLLRPGMSTIIFALSITGWIGMARFVRNQVLIIRDRDYNVASRTLGTSTWRIMTRNLLPYLVSVIMLRMALSIPGAIGSEVFITYIGLGLPVSIPSLGNLINAGRKLLATSASYQLVFPTIVLSMITISFYILGNSFADAADPKNHL